MAQFSLESIRRMRVLQLPKKVFDAMNADPPQLLLTQTSNHTVRKLGITEMKQLNVLKEYGGFELYHAIKYSVGKSQKTAFLVTSPFVDEWDMEFFADLAGFNCFAFVFDGTNMVPEKQILLIKITPSGLEVEPQDEMLKTSVFA